MRKIAEQGSKPEDEHRREGYEETIAETRQAVPIRIAGDKKVVRQKRQHRSGPHKRVLLNQEEQPDDRQGENRRPTQQSMIGGEQDPEECWRIPIPFPNCRVSRFKDASINNQARNESGRKR